MKQAYSSDVSYRYSGKEFDPSRDTILFVHGAGGNGLFWAGQLEHFSERYNALAVDLPGHTDEDGPGKDTVEDYLEDVKKLLDGLGLDKVIIAGLSMGGAITQMFALTYPERVKAAILISTGAKLKVMKQIFETIQKDFESYVNMMSEFAISRATPAEVIEPVQAELSKRAPDVVYNDFMACDRFDIRERISEIKVPVLIVHGLDDLLTPAKYHEFLSQAIQGAKMIRIEKAGHLVPVEKPDLVNQAIEEFLNSL